jgi:hypothetical protein
MVRKPNCFCGGFRLLFPMSICPFREGIRRLSSRRPKNSDGGGVTTQWPDAADTQPMYSINLSLCRPFHSVAELGGPAGALAPTMHGTPRIFFTQNIDLNWILVENYLYWPPLSENCCIWPMLISYLASAPASTSIHPPRSSAAANLPKQGLARLSPCKSRKLHVTPLDGVVFA